jgi:hypothetical protein
VDGIERLIRKDSVVDFILVFTTEGRLLQEHLVDEDTERPPVNRATILLIEQNLNETLVRYIPGNRHSTSRTYFRCHELGSTTERAGGAAVPHVFLAETVIGNLDVAIEGQENVVKLQITVDDTVLVEVLESQTDLRSIEPDDCKSISRAPKNNGQTSKTYCALFSPNWPR